MQSDSHGRVFPLNKRFETKPVRVILAKIGLDGHDRGIKVVASSLRDAGMEVIYTGLWQTPERVACAAADEDADVVGISLLSGAHLTLIPRMLELLRAEGIGHVPVMVGGVIPDDDIPKLLHLGAAKVFTPGTPMSEIVGFIRGALRQHAGQG